MIRKFSHEPTNFLLRVHGPIGGKWEEHLTSEEIQKAIDAFYVWKQRLTAEGKIKGGQCWRNKAKSLGRAGQSVPYPETKEVIGGYWFILANSLEEAAAIAAENPCMACGLYFAVQPIDPDKGSAYRVTSETPTPDH